VFETGVRKMDHLSLNKKRKEKGKIEKTKRAGGEKRKVERGKQTVW
jgi:hypothetical protein